MFLSFECFYYNNLEWLMLALSFVGDKLVMLVEQPANSSATGPWLPDTTTTLSGSRTATVPGMQQCNTMLVSTNSDEYAVSSASWQHARL
jgi:hypothetical protein